MENHQTYNSLQEFLDSVGENCLLLARHGESDWNAVGILQGQQDRPLSPRGSQQRKNLFFLLQSVTLARIFTSTLQRTVQTAIPISEEKELTLVQLAELDEAGLGVFEGLSRSFGSDDESGKLYQSFLNDEINVALPGGGESLRMVDKRITQPVALFLDTVRNLGHTLVVGHRNVNKMILRNLLGLSFEEAYRVEHESNCLYVYAPIRGTIAFLRIGSPDSKVEIEPGYQRID